MHVVLVIENRARATLAYGKTSFNSTYNPLLDNLR